MVSSKQVLHIKSVKLSKKFAECALPSSTKDNTSNAKHAQFFILHLLILLVMFQEKIYQERNRVSVGMQSKKFGLNECDPAKLYQNLLNQIAFTFLVGFTEERICEV